MRVRVNVKQEHIDKGAPRVGDMCPIALSLREKFPEFNWWVYYTTIALSLPFKSTDQIPMPKPAQEFISKFDVEEPVKPFGFYLNIPDWIMDNAHKSNAATH